MELMIDSSIEDFFQSEEGRLLYQKAMSLYQLTEKNHAKHIEVNGIQLGYLEFGPATGTPLIWAHGSGLTSYEILNVQAGLVAMGYRVIAIDYRGHGKTQLTFDGINTSIYHVADDIAALMAVLEIPKALIGGLSKGGFIAAAFYDAYPDMTLGLLLEDGGSFSLIQLWDDIALGVVTETSVEYNSKLYDRLKSPFDSLMEALVAEIALNHPTGVCYKTPSYLAMILSMIHETESGQFVHHCNEWDLMQVSPTSDVVDPTLERRYSRLPIMTRSQDALIPSVVFRNLQVPVHIIDPVSDNTYLPVSHQNEALQAQHPQWIAHETYKYPFSPHEAHWQYPERFLNSASVLLKRVKDCAN